MIDSNAENYQENTLDTEVTRERSIQTTMKLVGEIQESNSATGSIEANSSLLINNPLTSSQNETSNRAQNEPPLLSSSHTARAWPQNEQHRLHAEDFKNLITAEPKSLIQKITKTDKIDLQMPNLERERPENEHSPPPAGEFKLTIPDGTKKSNACLPHPPPLTVQNNTPDIPSIFPNNRDKNILQERKTNNLFERSKSPNTNPFPVSQTKSHKYKIPSVSKEIKIKDYTISSESSESEMNDTDRIIPSVRSSIRDEASIPAPSVFMTKNQFIKEQLDERSQKSQIKLQQSVFEDENSSNLSEDKNSSNLSEDENSSNQSGYIDMTQSFEDSGQDKMTQKQPPNSLNQPWKQNPNTPVSKLPPPPKTFNVILKSDIQPKQSKVAIDEGYNSDDFDSDEAEILYNNTPKELINTPEDLINAPKDLKTTPKDLINTPKDLKNVAKDLKNTPQDLINAPKDLTNTPKDLKNTPQDLINTSKNLKNTPKDLINEEQFSLAIPAMLENLLWLLNHRQMFLSGSHTRIFTALCALTENAPEAMKPGFTSLLSSFHCEKCQVNLYEGVTSCNHKLCKECSIESLRKRTNGLILLTTYEEESFRTMCPKCKKKLLDKDLEAILGDNYEIYDLERNKRQLEQDNQRRHAYMSTSSETDHECFTCHKELKDEMCFKNDVCKHQCKECLASSMRRGRTGCPHCRQTYSMNISTENDICQGCNQLMYFIGNNLRKVCNGHLMCNRCINESYQAKKCKICKITADRNLLLEFDRILFGRCTGPCEQKKLLDYFILKECCNQDVCIECQANDKEACIKCRKPLGNWAKQQLQYIASRQSI
ncbi:unnamed protein product [Blepharisma stoltei]|uniref:RING-type domain-containing protein n=1 Tax=Blepharisma stoltei TaxID=1481888 RepID=A0AAU9I8C7_9CILI|nr:unnamed protein product [Blepharisma stoltei]